MKLISRDYILRQQLFGKDPKILNLKTYPSVWKHFHARNVEYQHDTLCQSTSDLRVRERRVPWIKKVLHIKVNYIIASEWAKVYIWIFPNIDQSVWHSIKQSSFFILLNDWKLFLCFKALAQLIEVTFLCNIFTSIYRS